jgi:hypothetical protein
MAGLGLNFDNIDLDLDRLLSGNNLAIGHGTIGLNSEDAAKLAIGVAQAQQNTVYQQEQQERQDRERRLLIAAGSSIAIGLFLLSIYLISLKINR